MRGGAVVALALVAVAGDARAQPEPLRDVAGRVADEWRKAGGAVDRGPPRFLYSDETMTVTVPPAATAGGDTTCTTVALLGARGLSFHAKIAGAEEDPLSDDQSWRAASVAGVLEMSSCGPNALPLEHLLVTSDGGLGAIETVVARSAKPLPSLRTVLPERTGGVLPPPPDAGVPPSLPSPMKRAEVAEVRAKRDGAKPEGRTTWTAGRDGGGDARVTLDPGCHRIELFAPDAHSLRISPRRRRLDVDAELRGSDDELLARDRTDAADAHLEACVGEPTDATVIFAGAPPGAAVVATHVFWPIPDLLPAVWSPEGRARMARALHARHADPPREPAIALYRGSVGVTAIPVAIEPGACYLAVAAVTDGQPRGLGLRAVLQARDARDERTADDDAGVVAFCARDADRARLEVEARGASLSWGLALYRVAGRMWEAQ